MSREKEAGDLVFQIAFEKWATEKNRQIDEIQTSVEKNFKKWCDEKNVMVDKANAEIENRSKTAMAERKTALKAQLRHMVVVEKFLANQNKILARLEKKLKK